MNETLASVNIKNIIGVISGKGGVGKSFVTASLAASLKKRGYTVGIMDADITGPSIPRMFGVTGKLYSDEEGIIPSETKDGIKLVSMNLLLDKESDPVVWRGPLIAGTINQFYSEVKWGELDYLLIDMPPGTGDVALTVFQSIPLKSIVIVTSPQSLVDMIVKKAVKMASMLHIKIAGVVENFSYIECPDCGKKIYMYGQSHIDEIAGELGVEVLAKLPLMPGMAEAADTGRFFEQDLSVFDEVEL